MAQILEHLSLIRVESWLIAGVPRYKLPKVHHVPRPGEQEAKPRVISPSELARMVVG